MLVAETNTKRGGKRNITANLEIDKREIENFQELERTVYRTVLKLGCEIINKALEAMDEQLLGNRDVKRFRCKGFQKTCIKTIMGPVEFKRRVYLDNAAVEGSHCVHLLDCKFRSKSRSCTEFQPNLHGVLAEVSRSRAEVLYNSLSTLVA